MNFAAFIKSCKYPANWKSIRIVIMISGIILWIVIGGVFLNTYEREIRYVEEEVSAATLFREAVNQNLPMPEGGFTPEIRVVPREVPVFPVITWALLIIGVIYIISFWIADLFFWRCMVCRAPFWFWLHRSWLQFFIENCPKCGEDIYLMHD